jgi:hypothetical protein
MCNLLMHVVAVCLRHNPELDKPNPTLLKCYKRTTLRKELSGRQASLKVSSAVCSNEETCKNKVRSFKLRPNK